MASKKTLTEYIRICEQMIAFFKNELNEQSQENSDYYEYLQEFSQLREIVKSWKEIKPPPINKVKKAETILSEMDLSGKMFLDFGCGEGHVAVKSRNSNTTMSVGYDIENQHWEMLRKDDKTLLTTDKSRVESLAPYDVILLQDVIDHVENPEETMAWLKKMGKKIYIKCHPWTAKHATHIFKHPYLHLIFTYEELIKLGYKGIYTHKTIDPLTTYRTWFSDFKIISENPILELVDKEYLQGIVLNRIFDPNVEELLESVDYILE